MSTPATITFDRMTYFQSHDGYPDVVIPEIKQFVKNAKEMAEKNPDFSFARALTILLIEAEYQCSEVNAFSTEYEYEIDIEGNVKQIEET